jgi:hypothetical protein
MKTKVINVKTDKDRGPNFLYIGRANPRYGLKKSKWANPFKPGKDGTRDEVMARYREWITRGEGQHLLADLHELRGKTLGCWCKPEACHGDILVELLENARGSR